MGWNDCDRDVNLLPGHGNELLDGFRTTGTSRLGVGGEHRLGRVGHGADSVRPDGAYFVIKKVAGGYKVVSESGKNLSRVLSSLAAAKKRLAQIHYFKTKGK